MGSLIYLAYVILPHLHVPPIFPVLIGQLSWQPLAVAAAAWDLCLLFYYFQGCLPARHFPGWPSWVFIEVGECLDATKRATDCLNGRGRWSLRSCLEIYLVPGWG